MSEMLRLENWHLVSEVHRGAASHIKLAAVEHCIRFLLVTDVCMNVAADHQIRTADIGHADAHG